MVYNIRSLLWQERILVRVITSLDFLLYDKTDNLTSAIRFTATTFVSTTCGILVGDSNFGFDGNFTEFRIFTGTGAIPGMPYLSQQNCPDGVGIITGTQTSCSQSCSATTNCTVCPTATFCLACLQSYYLYNDGVDNPDCQTSCPFGYVADYALAACVPCTSGEVFFNNTCSNDCPSGYVPSESGGCSICNGGDFFTTIRV